MQYFLDSRIQVLLESTHLPKTVFTQKLRVFYKEKKCTSSCDCPIDPSDAKAIFSTLREKVSDPSISLDEQYNTARLIRLSLSWKIQQSIFAEMFADMLQYIEKNALHSNGNVRNEIGFFFHDFLFVIDKMVGPRYPRKVRNKKEQSYADICVPAVISYHRTLVEQESEYVQKHHDELEEEDTYDRGYIPFSGDTHDKTLARIRRVLECMDYPYIMRAFEGYGYRPYRRDEDNDWDAKMQETLISPKIDPISFEKDLQFFLILSKLPVTMEDIKKRIFHAETLSMTGNRQYNEWLFSLLAEKNIELTQAILDIFATAWNVFPHQSLGGMSPQEKVRELYGR